MEGQKNTKAYEIEWDADIESVLRQVKTIANDIFAGTDYYAERNTTIGEKNIDIFKIGESKRVGQLWPGRRERVITVALKVEIIKLLKNRIELPEITDIKPGRYPGWGGFNKISLEKTVEVLQNV